MDCIGYEEEYKIYPDGRVYGKKYKIFLKPRLNNCGYYHINLSKNGIKTTHYIHKLIATHYIPNPDNLPIADHIDLDRTNNDVSNLRWISYRGSVLHRTNSSLTPNIQIIRNGTYQVKIFKSNKYIFTKTFKTLADAENARDTFILENGI